jgi:hypothetical protein
MPLVAGKRILRKSPGNSFSMKAMIFLASALSASNSMPA